MIHPDYPAFLRLCECGNAVPVYLDLAADGDTPLGVYHKLGDEQTTRFLFESIVGGEQISRYSFVGAEPKEVYVINAESTEVRRKDGSTRTLPTPADPLTLIETAMAEYRAVPMPDKIPFSGGAVGYLGYEYVHHVETTVPVPEADPVGVPRIFYMITDAVVIFDHVRQILRICAYADLRGSDPKQAYAEAVATIEGIREKIARPGSLPQATADVAAAGAPGVLPGNFTRESFEEAVRTVKEYIRAGDVIQTVLSQRFEKDFKASPTHLYRALRMVNPSPYMTLMEGPGFAIVGASPELHVRLTGRQVEIRPIAGTRHRGADEAEDIRLEADLLADEKERAEHLMLVDLARNDIGRVCQYGSVTVPNYMMVERYSHVMHIVSKVTGILAEERNAYDLMRATFPAGTLSGAPKVRAMQIIAEIERERRGVYGGAIGYFSFDGNHDSCIGIRTAVIRDGRIYIQSGAGIVADSSPEAEYAETLNKAKAMLTAVNLAEYFHGQ